MSKTIPQLHLPYLLIWINPVYDIYYNHLAIITVSECIYTRKLWCKQWKDWSSAVTGIINASGLATSFPMIKTCFSKGTLVQYGFRGLQLLGTGWCGCNIKGYDLGSDSSFAICYMLIISLKLSSPGYKVLSSSWTVVCSASRSHTQMLILNLLPIQVQLRVQITHPNPRGSASNVPDEMGNHPPPTFFFARGP